MLNVYFAARGKPYFNMMTRADNSAASIYNDRPAFATDLSRKSVVRTAHGVFDTVPLPNPIIILYNYGRTPAFVDSELSLQNTFRFAVRRAALSSSNASLSAPEAKYHPLIGGDAATC